MHQASKIAQIVDEAFAAAKEAAAKKIADNPDTWYPCGFAWVNIKPARGPVVKYLKENGLGRTSMTGGFDIWNPSDNATQWMDDKYEGAKAFTEVLNKNLGVNARAQQRID